jgi:hypothetical protein
MSNLKDISAGDSVAFLLTGNLITGETFEGSTAVKVIRRGKKKNTRCTTGILTHRIQNY